MLKSTEIISFKHLISAAVAVIILTVLLAVSLAATASPAISRPQLQQVRQHYGQEAQARLQQWQQILNHSKGKSEVEQLKLTNDFINLIEFIHSPFYQDGLDYRLSPMAFLILGAGDSEEFSMAKYFTLRKMGIQASRLRLTYTERQSNLTPHMVLAYYPSADADPLILDYLDKTIRPLSQRQDLRPVYSFDAEQLWLMQSDASRQIQQQLARPLEDPEVSALLLIRPVAITDTVHF
jgi:predicted transglutaminase-like cysteine proteinase